MQINEEAVRKALADLLAFPPIGENARSRDFLSYVVNRTLAGESAQLKEYSLGVDVFSRRADFDPKADSVVRNEARRLRAKLREYYWGPGAADPLRILLPKGGYVPEFVAIPAIDPIQTNGISTLRNPQSHSYSPSVRAAIWEHVDGVVSSRAFANSKRLCAFLRWVVEQEISGNRGKITERGLALELYQRGPDFDPKIDGTVRAEAIRLRNKLLEYYESVTDNSPRIEIPKGGYVPLFVGFEDQELPPSPESSSSSIPLIHRRTVLALGSAVICLILGVLAFRLKSTPSPAELAEANRLYNHARELWRVGENPKARENLERALKLYPRSAKAHLLYSSVLQRLGYEDRAHEQALEARRLALSADHSAELEFEAFLRVTETDPAGAVRAYRFLAERTPTDFDTLQHLAEAHATALDFESCIHIAEQARALPEGMKNPELERAEALCLASKDDGVAALEHIKRGEAFAETAGLKDALGRLVLLHAGVVQNYGGDSPPLLERARTLCHEAGDELCQAKAARVLGNRLLGSAQFTDAARLYREGLSIVERLHNHRELANIVAGLETVLIDMGDLRGADDVYTRFASGTWIANHSDMVSMRSRIAYLRGDLNEAEVLMRNDMERFARTVEPGVEANHRMSLAIILLERGELTESRNQLGRAGDLIRRHQVPGSLARWHVYNAILESAAGNAERALGELDAVDRVPAKDISITDRFEFSNAALRIHLRQGDDAYLASHASTDAETEAKAGCSASAAEILAMLAESRFRAGNPGSAQEALTRAKAGMRVDSPLMTRLAVLRAEVLLSADWNEAERLSSEAVQLASRAGFLVESYEGRLIREERRWRDNPTDAIRRLNELRTESARQGLASIADRAAKLSRFQAQASRGACFILSGYKKGNH